jgi:anthranilate phosphoribosyltransferase
MASPLKATLEALLERRHLTEAEAGELLVALTDPELSPAMAGALLAALRSKGITADEVRGFANAMRRLARKPDISAGSPTVDVVGTGGDASGSLNLSTGTALLAAACGLRVVKHGNRAMSSRCGSADLLAALGLPVPLEEQAAVRCLDQTGFTFLFAPHYHPALKSLAPVRTALGVRTVFNMLGPLANPADRRST